MHFLTGKIEVAKFFVGISCMCVSYFIFRYIVYMNDAYRPLFYITYNTIGMLYASMNKNKAFARGEITGLEDG